ncbi:MAG: hypothetical protein QOF83_2382 [Solirubrobacteraceae bacterium]|nr:hypothetical protein [Solirubrobacteraceae bacterium]
MAMKIKRCAVLATGVVAALAITGPVAGASAATPAWPTLPTYAFPSLPPISSLPAFQPAPLSFVGPSIGSIGVAIGPTVIGSVFNGGTTVCVSTLATACSTNASP